MLRFVWQLRKSFITSNLGVSLLEIPLKQMTTRSKSFVGRSSSPFDIKVYMKELDKERHANCEMSIRYKPVKSSEVFRPALFCKQHNKYLDWLSKHLAEDLINSGVAEEPWDFTKKKRAKNSDNTNVLKKRKSNRKTSQKLNRKHLAQTGRNL